MTLSQVCPEVEHLGLEAVAESFANVYKIVGLADLPMYRWLQIVNDVTILLEETRRGAVREAEALERSLKVLMRLLDFIGFYLHVLPEADHANRGFADFVAQCLRSPSYGIYLDEGDPEEGPTRWILAKYPGSCAKCGEDVCHCVLTPWVFEERRQDPEEFLEIRKKVSDKLDVLRERWKTGDLKYFTLPSVLASFATIYRNAYYHQDIWKIVMHLSEEVGEATTELSRLELLFLIRERGYELDSPERWSAIEKQGTAIVREKLRPIIDDNKRRTIEESTLREMTEVSRNLQENRDPLLAAAGLVAAKFKEEIADVFSWLSATIYQLYKLRNGKIIDEEAIWKLLGDHGYIETAKHQVRFTCPQCTEPECNDNCLVEHAVAAELYEKVAQL